MSESNQENNDKTEDAGEELTKLIVPSTDIVKSDKAESTEFDTIAAFVSHYKNEDFSPVKGCKFCASKHREEGEQLNLKGWSYLKIHNWLKDEKKEYISYPGVRNHLMKHFGKRKKSLTLEDYAKDINRWATLSTKDESMINRYIVMFDKEVVTLMSQNDDDEVTMSEKRKNMETAAKATQLILELKGQLKEINSERRPVELIITSLNNIIQIKLNNGCTAETRSMLLEIVDQLKKEVGDIDVEGVNS